MCVSVCVCDNGIEDPRPPIQHKLSKKLAPPQKGGRSQEIEEEENPPVIEERDRYFEILPFFLKLIFLPCLRQGRKKDKKKTKVPHIVYWVLFSLQVLLLGPQYKTARPTCRSGRACYCDVCASVRACLGQVFADSCVSRQASPGRKNTKALLLEL